VLAAGLGERLRPLTLRLPKPLLPVRGEPNAGRTLRRLSAAGVESAVLNLHHLGSEIRQRFGDRYAGLPLTYSEEPVLLGTLGPLAELHEYLGAHRRFLVVNGDSLCDWPIERLLASHERARARARGSRKPLATLLLSSRADPALFGGGVGIGADGRIVDFRAAARPARGEARARRVFAGCHVLESELLARVPKGPGDIVRGLYEPLLAEGAVLRGLTTARRWHDLGTSERYRLAVLDASGPSRVPGCTIDPTARVRRSVIESGAIVEAGAVVVDSVVLPGATVLAGSRHRDELII
jgi:mannose-1-phosphate guanylyltransferase